MLQLSNGRALRQTAVSSRSAVSLKVSRDRNGHRWCPSRVLKLNRNLLLSRISQPVRAVSIKAAAEDVEVTNNGAVGAAQASNMLDFEELSDIVRCAVRPTAAIMGFHRRLLWLWSDPLSCNCKGAGYVLILHPYPNASSSTVTGSCRCTVCNLI